MSSVTAGLQVTNMAVAKPQVSKPDPGLASSGPSRAMIILAFAAVYLIWGSTYLGIRYAIETLPPFLMAGTRFLVAGSLLFTWAMIRQREALPTFSQWRRALVVGVLLLLCGNGGVTWAEKYIPSGLAALLVATEPLWVVLLNWILSRRRPNVKVLLGVFIGLVGVAILVSDRFSAGPSEVMIWVGAAVILLASLAWASGSVYSNRRPSCGSTTLSSGMQMLTGGSLLFLLGLITGDLGRLNIEKTSWTSIIAFLYLIVFGALLAFTAYSWLLRNVSPARAATYAYVNPAVAVFLGWLIAGEPLSIRMLFAAAVIVVSVVLITTYSREVTQEKNTDEIHTSECPPHPCA
jgi:drug/metabolite transporter (DMT)-like permease